MNRNDLKRIILASSSLRRQEILDQVRLDYRILPSEIEENTEKRLPKEIVLELSEQKAIDVFKKTKETAIVIGADTIVAYEEEIMGKPKDENQAYHMINMLQGNTHQVYTGVTIIWRDEKEEKVTFTETTSVTVYPMEESEICSYIKTKEPYDKAGGYAIQGIFAPYIQAIQGDYYNVVGLPVARLYQEMKKRGLWVEKLS